MAAPKVSKLSEQDARGLLAQLQKSGEGWYIGLATAVNAGAHKTLGMDRREFVAQVGQRLIDPRDAIIELHQQGMSQTAIAEILHVAQDRTVNRVLAEEGLVTPSARTAGGAPKQIARAAGDLVDSTAEEVDEEIEELEARVEDLEDALAEAKGATKTATKDLREALEKAQKQIRDYREAELQRERDRRDAVARGESDEDRERREKENEAFVEEVMGPVHAFAASMDAQAVVGLFEEATEHISRIIEKGATAAIISQIAAARDAFNTEFAVAEAMAAREE